MSILPPIPPPPPGGTDSVPPPFGNRLLWDSGCWWPCEKKTCHTWGNRDKVGYPPPGSRLCPAYGGVKSEPGGWSGLKPHSVTHQLGTVSAIDAFGNILGDFGPPGEGGGGCSPWPPQTTPCWLWRYIILIETLYIVLEILKTKHEIKGRQIILQHQQNIWL